MSDDRIDDIEERMLVLRDKAAREGFSVPPDVLDYIAEKYALPQTLKGALINVQAYASRRGIPVDMDVARLVLDGIRAPQAGAVPAEAVDTFAEQPEATEPAFEPLGAPFADVRPEEAPFAEQPAQPELVLEPEQAEDADSSLEDALSSVLGATVLASDHEVGVAVDTPYSRGSGEPFGDGPDAVEPLLDEPSLFVVEAPEQVSVTPHPEPEPAPAPPVAAAVEPPAWLQSGGWQRPEPVAPAPDPEPEPEPEPEPAVVWFAPVRTTKKESLVARAGRLLERAGIRSAIAEGDLVAIKLHFGEEGNTGFVSPVFLRETVRIVREAGGNPFLTDSNTLYRGKRANAVDHLTCAIRNGFSFATVDAPLIIADGLDGREGVDVPIEGFDHFDSVRIGAAAVHADAMVVVTHVKGHEATGMGGALKNVGMGLGCRSSKQRMHSDLKPDVSAPKCTACGRCVKWCPVDAIAIGPDRVAQIDYELCYGCGECVASCPYGAIAIQWKTEADALQHKIVEHAAGALRGKEGKVVYLSFVMNVSPDCDCWHFSDASIVSDIGILASTDIVAIDQAAYDMVTAARGLPGSRAEGMAEGRDKFGEITGVDPTLEVKYAEQHGLGTSSYVLRTMD